jgi:transmembrane sensor
MSELARRIEQASAHVEPAWSSDREARLRAGVGRGLERVRRQRIALVAVLGACTLLLGFFLGRQPLISPRMALADAPQPSLVQLPDGSSVNARSSDARVETVAVSPTGVSLRLQAGSARFSVTPNANRPFRVMARDVTVTVLGTVFSVTLDERGVRVDVERGRVRVEAPHERRVLAVGESASFESAPPAEPETSVDPLPAGEAHAADAHAADALLSGAEANVRPEPTLRAEPVTQPSWRALAKEQKYAAALARLTAEGSNAVRDTPEDLLLAADVARLGGRPDRAVAPLQRVIANHAFDPRAPLAAFTLGRTLLEQLGRPRDAAQAFATARRLDRGGALTQDALAREVESWAGAGDAEQAHVRALEYLKLYPSGRRLAAVRRLGGLD